MISSQPAFRLTDQMLSDILNIDYIRNNLEIRLIPEDQIHNHVANHRCIKQLPNCDFGLGFAIRINDQVGVTITEDFLMSTGRSFEDYWQMWLKNAHEEIEITPLDEFLAAFFTDPTVERPEPALPVYVCKYRTNSPGGACILHPQAQEKLLELLGPFYIVFSSIHEALIISQKDASARDLQTILREINSKPDIVRPEEVASNYVYGVVTPRQLERQVCD